MTYVIDLGRCISCGWCSTQCPTGAVRSFFAARVTRVIEVEWCIDCDICAQVCPSDCITHRPELQPSAEQLELAKRRAAAFVRASSGYAGSNGKGMPPPWLRRSRVTD